MRREDGHTLREHLESAERQTGRVPQRLDIEPIPIWAVWHVRAWSDICSGRSHTGMGLTPLTWMDLSAWRSFSGYRITPRDVKIIRHIDNVWIEVQNDDAHKGKKPEAKTG